MISPIYAIWSKNNIVQIFVAFQRRMIDAIVTAIHTASRGIQMTSRVDHARAATVDGAAGHAESTVAASRQSNIGSSRDGQTGRPFWV
jgi:hypothetical protein